MKEAFFEVAEKREFTPRELREKLKDPNFTPSFGDLKHQFNLLLQEDNRARELEKLDDLKHPNGLGRRRQRPEQKKWKKFLFEDIPPFFEIFNKEYIEALSNYLVDRIRKLNPDGKSPVTILELGAGTGKLSHLIRQKLEELIPGQFQVVATDSGDWEEVAPLFSVEKIGYKEALDKHNPQIVIASWMPWDGDDWTMDIRASKSVREYVLIGEARGCCGPSTVWDEELYQKDGFKNQELEDLTALQFSRTEFNNPEYVGHSRTYKSRTISFRKTKPIRI